MIYATKHEWFKGEVVKKDHPYPDISEAEQERLIRLGLAYRVEPEGIEPERPDMSNTKAEIRAYLDEQGIEYGDETKAELLEL